MMDRKSARLVPYTSLPVNAKYARLGMETCKKSPKSLRHERQLVPALQYYKLTDLFYDGMVLGISKDNLKFSFMLATEHTALRMF